MDRVVMEEKLESLRRCVARVQDKCPATAEALAQDLDAQDIVSLNLTRAVQLCVDLASQVIARRQLTAPATMGQAFALLAQAGLLPDELAHRLIKAVGFRNLAVHNYDAIDWRIVHALSHRHLDDFRAFAAHILQLESP